MGNSLVGYALTLSVTLWIFIARPGVGEHYIPQDRKYPTALSPAQ